MWTKSARRSSGARAASRHVYRAQPMRSFPSLGPRGLGLQRGACVRHFLVPLFSTLELKPHASRTPARLAAEPPSSRTATRPPTLCASASMALSTRAEQVHALPADAPRVRPPRSGRAQGAAYNTSFMERQNDEQISLLSNKVRAPRSRCAPSSLARAGQTSERQSGKASTRLLCIGSILARRSPVCASARRCCSSARLCASRSRSSSR